MACIRRAGTDVIRPKAGQRYVDIRTRRMAPSPTVACFTAHTHSNPLSNRRATSQTRHLQARMPLLKKSAKHPAALADPRFIMFTKSSMATPRSRPITVFAPIIMDIPLE
ncbi:MAG: hypothetical protein Q9212_000839 [Teloschistes hypoglaucus]